MTDRMRRRTKGLQPKTEDLETRRLMASHLAGVDIDGDRWVLDLIGPGDFNVTRRPDSDGDTIPFDQPGLIDTISIAGTGPKSSRLVGQVFKGPNGDGRVYFNTMEQFGGDTQLVNGTAGLLAIDIPDFWLGSTDPERTGGGEAGSISIPDGVVTLRFGGVDATAFFGTDEANRVNRNNSADQFNVRLGLPFFAGTSIIANTIISDAQEDDNNTTQQDSVTFTVAGRLNLFEVNNVVGNTELPPNPFAPTGGTVVRVSPGTGGITPAVGEIRVNGNATNFSVQVQSNSNFGGGGTERLKTFFVGGEADNVSLTAPGGARLVKFGRGLDTVNINTHVIETLEANRSAINSEIVTERTIGRVTIGGDAINTRVLTGYSAAPGDTAIAQIGGGMTVLIGGDIKNSIFAASVEPQGASTEDGSQDTGFGGTDDIVIPGAAIDAKVEGKIDNSDIAPAARRQAFFASSVRLEQGPIAPPSVPEPPFALPMPRPRSIGIPQLKGSQVRPLARREALGNNNNNNNNNNDNASAARARASANNNARNSIVNGANARLANQRRAVPGGPLAAQRARIAIDR